MNRFQHTSDADDSVIENLRAIDSCIMASTMQEIQDNIHEVFDLIEGLDDQITDAKAENEEKNSGRK